jgi:chemotaxis protein histidine kinase CheA
MLHRSLLFLILVLLFVTFPTRAGRAETSEALVDALAQDLATSDEASAEEEEETVPKATAETTRPSLSSQQEANVCAPPHEVPDCAELEKEIGALTSTVSKLQHQLDATEKADSLACSARIEKAQKDWEDKLQAVSEELAATKTQTQQQQDAEEQQRQHALDEALAELDVLRREHQLALKDRNELSDQLERTVSQLSQLVKDNEGLSDESRHLKAALGTLEDRVTAKRDQEQQKFRKMQSELKFLREEWNRSQHQLLQARQETHEIWERYVLVRDAWWNVLTLARKLADFAGRNRDRIWTWLERLHRFVVPYMVRLQRVVAAGAWRANRILRKGIGAAQSWWKSWLVPNWKRYCHPHVARAREWMAKQSNTLWARTKKQGRVLRHFLAQKWTEARTAAEPHMKHFQQIVQPTLDMVSAQLEPVLAGVRSVAGPIHSRIASSVILESALRATREWEARGLRGIASAADVAKDYLVLRQAPEVAVMSLHWVHLAAMADATSLQRPPTTASSWSSSPLPSFSVRLYILNAMLAIAATVALKNLARLFFRSIAALTKRGRSLQSSSSPSRLGSKPYSSGWKLR